MADVEHYHRGNASHALISFEQCKLLLRPMLKGSLEQVSVSLWVPVGYLCLLPLHEVSRGRTRFIRTITHGFN